MKKILRAISVDELQDIVKEHRTWVASKMLRGTRADLRLADLRKVNLSGFDLTFADFTDASLLGAICCQTNFYRADFTRADISHCDFTDANLSNSKLHEVLMIGTKMDSCRLYNVSITDDVYRVNKKLFSSIRSCIVIPKPRSDATLKK